MARYDGLADWYEGYISGDAAAFTAEAGAALIRLLGRGVGRCLDVGCGTGVYAVYAMMIHTDVSDIADVFAEMGRVLASGGRFVYVGTHPCFVAPFIARQSDRTTVIYPGYSEARRHDQGPGIGDGIRARVGAYHHPLSALIGALPAAGLQIDSIEELYGDPPRLFALGACRAQSAAT